MYRNEIEKLFIEDCREKKRTGSGAFHKASRGIAPVRVHNQSDNLTAKELREMSGEVVSYMRKPMEWEDFRDLPVEAQKKYYMWLKDEFGVSDFRIASMLGIENVYFSKYKTSRIGIEPCHGRKMGKKQIEKWERFVNCEKESECKAEEAEAKKIVKAIRNLTIEADGMGEIIESLKSALPLMTEGHYYVSVSVFPQNEMGVAHCVQIPE